MGDTQKKDLKKLRIYLPTKVLNKIDNQKDIEGSLSIKIEKLVLAAIAKRNYEEEEYNNDTRS